MVSVWFSEAMPLWRERLLNRTDGIAERIITLLTGMSYIFLPQPTKPTVCIMSKGQPSANNKQGLNGGCFS